MYNEELYIVLDSPIHKTGELAKVYILASGRRKNNAVLELRDYKGILAYVNINLEPGKQTVHALEFQVPKTPGRYELLLRRNGEIVDKAVYKVIEEYEFPQEKYIVFTWHNHQAPGYLPDGRYYFPWAFKHTYEDELAPYGKGPYNYHALMLEKYPGYKCTYNLSPSLLAQWVQLINEGIVFQDGKSISKSSFEAGIVRETLELYRKAASRGQIDVLTSVYAHTIAGYIIEYLNAEDIIKEEIEYGMEITREVIGIVPKGIWTPEMAFSMKLVDIYSDLGIMYTILDQKCHLEKSIGEVGNHLEPYLIKGTKGELIVFFRDTDLSNYVGFKNNFKSELHAWKSAYELSYQIIEKLTTHGVLTIALDGENWMIFAKSPSLTAYFYSKLIEYLIKIQESGYAVTANHREILNKYNPRRVLRHVPTTTWLCGFTKWHGEIKEHDQYWIKTKQLYSIIKQYEEKHGRDEKSKQARRALWHALDSDYWWAEFWEPSVINTWLCEASRQLGLEQAYCENK
ncbi:MAG: glycoside hydrolase family 57 protein [Desulfurococcaceae archaeon]